MAARLSVCALVVLVAGVAGRHAHESWAGAASGRAGRAGEPGELDAEFWVQEAQRGVRERAKPDLARTRAARNVIMFLGDGLSLTTTAATRVYKGRQAGHPGEEQVLIYETFPVTGLAKTYCVDNQVADSACTATAYLSGVKNNKDTVGVTARVKYDDCAGQADESTHVPSIAAWALQDGRAAGVVTNTRITHASPAGTYAHVANRDWEWDCAVTDSGGDPAMCPDIAHQLVHGYPGRNFKVIIGGGRRNFRPPGGTPNGRRCDERNLIEEWEADKRARNVTYEYAESAAELRAIDLNNTEYVMALLAQSHLPYHLHTDEVTTPPLAELTELAITSLSAHSEGYFLFVEGGLIDRAHHDNFIREALDETAELDRAVQRALELTDDEDTLVLVTADHSHVMAYSGYSPRGSDVLGRAGTTDVLGVPYQILSYANGPGFRSHAAVGIRADITEETDYGTLEWRSHADAQRNSETHGGEDVIVYARGPQQHMFAGVYEQSQLPHLMGYAACLGNGLHAPACLGDAVHAPACDAASPAAKLPALLLAGAALLRFTMSL